MTDARLAGFDHLITLKDYPVEDWNPPYCGELPIRIDRHGRWHYLDSPIGRERLVQLFSRILKFEDGRYYLVTPGEKIGITVEDAPFLAVALEVEGQGEQRRLMFSTNIGEAVVADAEHRLCVTTDPQSGEPAPYLHVRRGLQAKLSRPVFYELVELAEETEQEGRTALCVRSAGQVFSLGFL